VIEDDGMTMTLDDGDVQVETLTLIDGSNALSAVDRASIDIQIATAKQYPRSIAKSLKEAMTLATLDEETAGSMFYSLKRSGKLIPGPSVRLAEVMSYAWGNLRVDADIVAEDKTMVTAMGTCFDLEKNVAVRIRVKRRITDSKGKRYNDDMIGVTSNAAIAIALRNAVFKVVPRSFVNRIYNAAKQASLGKGTIAEKRENSLEWFGRQGVKPEQVYELLGVQGIDDLGEDQLIALRGLKTAIKDGETTIDATFRAAKVGGAADLNAALGTKTADPAARGKKKADAAPSGTAPTGETEEDIRREELELLKKEGVE
jgi:hypothetical protein